MPNDPLELVSGAAQPIQDADQRLAATMLLTKARELSNVRAQPYDLKTSFTSSGGLPSDGSWTLEDVSPGRGVYRWTAQGPNYAAVNLYTTTTQGLLYSNQPGGIIPLRLAQVREAIFFFYPPIGPQTSLRTAVAYLNGTEQRCVLTAPAFGGQSFTGGRSWQESEYCVDSNTGVLTTYSPVPGLYIHFDYASAITFHGKIIPAGFTISEAGRTVIEAKTNSVTDPVDRTNALFDPAGLTPLGVGREMTPPARIRSLVPLINRSSAAFANANPIIQVVVLHGSVSPDGQLSEAEILASSDVSLNQTALDRASMWNRAGPNNRTQPGATPQAHETFFTFEFVTSPLRANGPRSNYEAETVGLTQGNLGDHSQWLKFVEGNPGIPGDGQIVAAGPNVLPVSVLPGPLFVPAPAVALGSVTNGFTLTVFPQGGSNVRAINYHVLALNPPTGCPITGWSTGTSMLGETVMVNGVQGRILNVTQQDIIAT